MLKEKGTQATVYRQTKVSKKIHARDFIFGEISGKFHTYKQSEPAYTRNMKRIKSFLEEKTFDFSTIKINPDILQGMPVINGTRLPVTLILAYLRDEENFDEILEDFPHITKEQIIDAIDYAINVIEDPYRNG